MKKMTLNWERFGYFDWLSLDGVITIRDASDDGFLA